MFIYTDRDREKETEKQSHQARVQDKTENGRNGRKAEKKPREGTRET
jgi:hypothetical protein